MYIHVISMWNQMFFNNLYVKSNVSRQCQWDTSCSSRRELLHAIVKSDFRLTGVEMWPSLFRKRGHIIWGTCKGRLVELGKRGLAEPGGAAYWTLQIKKNSKNPSKQSLVWEKGCWRIATALKWNCKIIWAMLSCLCIAWRLAWKCLCIGRCTAKTCGIALTCWWIAPPL